MSSNSSDRIPLAERLRPRTWEEFVGLDSLDRNLIKQLRAGQGRTPSLILWGPPGCGKTTLAKLIGRAAEAHFVEFSAVLGGVKEVREIVAEAEGNLQPTILFVDEIHRFNKGQQDAFLPHVERGTISLIGATTENPSFYLNGALLSRMRVLKFPPLADQHLAQCLSKGLQSLGLELQQASSDLVLRLAAGDARRLLNILESLASTLATSNPSEEEVRSFLKEAGSYVYDRAGDEHYQMASAFIKSMRGSDPDAALYWGFRMIESGEDPRFIIRRMICLAAEDISNADPRALQLAIATAEAYDRLGLPEGRIPIAQCIVYLACAPKSNRSYLAMHAVLAEIKKNPRAEVPLHLRNASTGLMKSLGYGDEYRYAHDFDGGYVPGENYLPEQLRGARFYTASDRGYEKIMAERLELLKQTPGEKS